jgi:hypothetical protein
MTKCKAKTGTGQPCKMQPLKGSSYCFTHSPEMGAKRAEAHRKGGERQRTPHYGDESIIPREVRTLEDANKILAYTLAETVPMENSIARARLLLALYDSYIKSFEVGELEKRIQLLEARQ